MPATAARKAEPFRLRAAGFVLTGMFRRPRKADGAAEKLYRAIVAQAREPVFYLEMGVPDSLDGRFELILLHVSLVINRLRRAGPAADRLAQSLFDELFRDMDVNLREMGVGDMGVARRIKAMGQAFYGRLRAYEAALEAPPERLEQALRRNLLGTVEADVRQLSEITDYVRRTAADLAAADPESLAQGRVSFAAPRRDPGAANSIDRKAALP